MLGKIWKTDIRTLGSGSAGGTNAYRSVGPFFAFLTICIDVIKGMLPILVTKNLDFNISLYCGIFIMIGHVYPIFFNFKGGKGAGPLLGVLIIINPYSLIYILPVWIISLIISGYVGLSTMLAACTLLVYSVIGSLDISFILFSGVILFLIVVTHRQNIKRMINGNENQFKSIMLFRRK